MTNNYYFFSVIAIILTNWFTELITYYNYYKNKLANDDSVSDNVKNIFNKILDSVTKYMDAEDYSDKIPEFIKFTSYLDQERKQNILMVTPQYKEMFDESRTTGAQ